MSTIPTWHFDSDGRVIAVRDAEHWQARKGGAVKCRLCYRRCQLADGEDGWCRYRGNRGGRMVLHAHGVISGFQHTMLAYKAATMVYRPGALATSIGGVHCTAGCRFCNSAQIVWTPDRLPWAYGERQLGRDGGWFYHRAMVHPAAAVATAHEWGASDLVFLENEPTLSYEWTLDCAQLAHAAGLGVVIFTNGFSTVEAVRALAPYVSHVNVGIKGSLDPQFYDRWMRSPGAVEHVKASILAWRDAGVHLLLSDLLPPQHMQTDNDHRAAVVEMTEWVARELGVLQPIMFGLMRKPGPLSETEGPLLPKNAKTSDVLHYTARLAETVAIVRARLHYAHIYEGNITLTCHACGGILVRKISPMRHCEPCVMQTHFCRFWRHEQHVTAGRCDHCGVSVPIQVLPPAQLRLAQRRAHALTSKAVFVSKGIA